MSFLEDKMIKVVTVIVAIPALLFGLLLLALLLAWPLELAWNYVVPYLFGLKEVTLLQAFALSFVSSTLFKSSSTGSKA